MAVRLKNMTVSEKTFFCEICNESFATRKTWKDHMAFGVCQQQICSVCEKVFTRRSSLREHLKTHTNTQAYFCEICDKRFTYKSTLDRHNQRRHTAQQFVCGLCEDIFTARTSLTKHMRIHKLFQCEVCKRRFAQNCELKMHREIHSGIRYPCGFCDKTFSLKGSLRAHTKYMHSENGSKEARKEKSLSNSDSNNSKRYKKKHNCNSCDEVFSSIKALKRHKRIHKVQSDYICDVCGRVCLSPSHFCVNDQSHTGVKTFSCSYCSQMFSDKQVLKIHERTHRGETYSCGICSMVFVRKFNLSEHVRTKHLDRKKYSCSICEKKFLRRYSLKKHMELHEREVFNPKKYPCRFCLTSFAFKYSMHRHISMKHSKEMEDLLRSAQTSTTNSLEKLSIASELGIGITNGGVNVTDNEMIEKLLNCLGSGSQGSTSSCSICCKILPSSAFVFSVDTDVVLCDNCHKSSTVCSLCDQLMQFSSLRTHLGHHTGEKIKTDTSRYKPI